MQDLKPIIDQAISDITAADNLSELENLRVIYLGKKGILTEMLKSLPTLTGADRPKFGQAVNQAKSEVTQQLNYRKQLLQANQIAAKLSAERIDVTLPGRSAAYGSEHPVTKVRQRINAFFAQMGFEMVEGPEIENDYYNFAALNIPEQHPARAMHDTFYCAHGLLLRTHTSPVQIRAMEQRKPPVRLIAPGRVYRVDSDVTHTPMFHQVEGLLIDEKANFAGLKGILQQFFQFFFEKELAIRFRPAYFPFTEPSAEVDIQCTHCDGDGCRSCKYNGWLEVLGCGMVHPNVLAAMNIDSEHYQGWAFGMGIDRLAMLRYGIDDLRMLFENDVKFLRQF